MSKREITPNNIYHIYNRGVLKMPIFKGQNDYKRFILKMIEYQIQNQVNILAFCLLPNHFHLLLQEPMGKVKASRSNISLYLQQLQNSHAKYFGKKYNHFGKVFQGTYKSKLIKNEKHYYKILNYIENNSVKHKVVEDAKEWPYSSSTFKVGQQLRL